MTLNDILKPSFVACIYTSCHIPNFSELKAPNFPNLNLLGLQSVRISKKKKYFLMYIFNNLKVLKCNL